MFVLDYYLFVNLLKFCDKSHLFPLLLTSKEVKDLTWRHLPIRFANCCHFLLCKKWLIDFQKINLDEIFINVCKKENLDIIKFLIQYPRVDPSDQNNCSIILASINGHLEIVKLLLQDCRIDEETKEIYRKKHNL